MSGFTVRLAEESDLKDWGNMRIALWGGDEDEAELLEELPELLDKSNDKTGWIMRDSDGAAIGFAEADIRSYTPDCEGPAPYLEGIWVSEAWRRKGLAAALLATVEDWARAKGHDEMGSDALLDNVVSHDWHGAQGFEEVERIVVFRKDI
ncbi:MAG: GNAT family N-acetyltransferase [Parasphingorhabdus sp.]